MDIGARGERSPLTGKCVVPLNDRDGREAEWLGLAEGV